MALFVIIDRSQLNFNNSAENNLCILAEKESKNKYKELNKCTH